jgi:phosphohistidine phosphatase
MRLYLVRHASAEEPGTRADADRRLTDRGRRESRHVGEGLKTLGARPVRILSSPFIRARETADAIASELSMAVEVRDALASGASPDDLLREVRDPGGEEVLLVAHQPELGALAALLLTGGPVATLSFRPGSVCCLDLDGAQGRLAWFRNPDDVVR